MADLRQTSGNLAMLRRQIAIDLATSIGPFHSLEQKRERFESALTEAVRAALGEPSEAMLESAWAQGVQCSGCLNTRLSALETWNAMAAALLRELDAEPPKKAE